MKLIFGAALSLLIGAGCRYFDLPVPSPPVLPGALLVLAMTLGYSAANKLLERRGDFARTAHLCGGPTGHTKAGAHATIAAKIRGDHHGI